MKVFLVCSAECELVSSHFPKDFVMLPLSILEFLLLQYLCIPTPTLLFPSRQELFLTHLYVLAGVSQCKCSVKYSENCLEVEVNLKESLVRACLYFKGSLLVNSIIGCLSLWVPELLEIGECTSGHFRGWEATRGWSQGRKRWSWSFAFPQFSLAK